MASITPVASTDKLNQGTVKINNSLTSLNNEKLEAGDNVSELTNDSGYLQDSPQDGTQYGRLDGAWSQIDTDITISQNVINGDYVIRPDGTKAYFSFDGTDYDFATNKVKDNGPYTSNDGTLTNFARNDGTVSGGVTIEGGAMKFDGTNNNLSIPGAVLTADNISLLVWVNLWEGTAAFDKVIGHIESSSNRIYLQASPTQNRFEWALGAGETKTFTVTETLGQWTLFGITINGGTAEIFRNGVSHGTFAYTGLTTIASTFNLGSLGANNRIGAYINNFTPYTGILTAAQQLEIYNAGTNLYTPISDGLISQYSGRNYAGTEATPTTIYDTNMIVSNGDREALRFDGVDDFVDVGASLGNFGFNDFTIPFDFVTGSNSTNHYTLISKGSFLLASEWILYEDMGGEFTFFSNSGGSEEIRLNIIKSLDTRYKGVVIKRGNLYQMWINGVMVAEQTVNKNTGFTNAQNLNIGRRSNGADRYRNKPIYEIGIINGRAWSEEEIKAYSQRTKKLFSDNNGSSGDFGISGQLTANKLNVRNIPTSATGLVSGDVWNDLGTLKIVT